jgi:pimeloyl-ACP methyl ester carboxylesterase
MKKSLLFLTLCLAAIGTTLHAQDTEEKFYKAADGTKIYYEVKGEGFPVVMVHGFTGTSQGWKRGALYGNLLKEGYKVILLDLRGNGRSGKPHTDEGYENDAEAKDIMGLVNSLGIKKYNVVGYSRGSIIVSRLLVLDAQRLNKAVMGGMGDDYTDPEWPRRIHAYKALMGDTTLHDVDDMMVWIRKNNFDNQALAMQQKHQPTTSKQELAKVKIPVLLVDGTEDKTNGSEIGLNHAIPNSVLKYVPGDHNSAGNSIQFSAAVTTFFK